MPGRTGEFLLNHDFTTFSNHTLSLYLTAEVLQVIPLEDLQPPDRGTAAVQSMPLLQGSEADARQVGTVFIRARSVDQPKDFRGGSVSREPQVDAPPQPSLDYSNLATRTPPGIEFSDEQPHSRRPKSSPVAELGFFDGSANSATRNSRPRSLDDEENAQFKVLPSDGKGQHVFDTPSARVFDMPAGQRRGRSSSPPQKRSVSPRNRVVSSFSMLERDSNAGRSSPAGSPTTATKRASVLLLRAPPHGASVVGEQVGVGVGLQMSTSGEFFVSSILDGTPAAHAAATDMVSVGDVVDAINGARCRGLPVEQVISMMKGPARTPVLLDLRRKDAPPPRPDQGRTSMLLIRMGEFFMKLVPQEQMFSEVLLHDLAMCSGSYPERFKYMGMEDHHDEIEASIEVTEELQGLDQRSSREICDHIVAQSGDGFSKLRQSPSMQHFRSIKHYLKSSNNSKPPNSRASHIAPTPLSKLEAAMEAIKLSNSVRKTDLSFRRDRSASRDPLSNFPDVEMSIGNPASSLRMHSFTALQVSAADLPFSLPSGHGGGFAHPKRTIDLRTSSEWCP